MKSISILGWTIIITTLVLSAAYVMGNVPLFIALLPLLGIPALITGVLSALIGFLFMLAMFSVAIFLIALFFSVLFVQFFKD